MSRTFAVHNPNRAPFVTVHFDGANGAKVELTDYIEKFDFDEDIEELDFVELTIKEAYSLEILNNTKLKTGTLLYFQFGYIGGKASIIKAAKISSIEAVYGKRITVEIKATDVGLALKKSSGNKIWRNMTGSQIATSIAKANSLKFVVEDSGKVFKEIMQGNMPDYSFLKYLGSLEPEVYLSYCNGDTVYYVKRNLGKTSLVTFKYGVDEVIRFNPRLNEVAVDKANIGAIDIGIDAKNKKVVSGKGDDDGDEVVGGNEAFVTFNSSMQVMRETVGSVTKIAAEATGAAANEPYMKDLPAELKTSGASVNVTPSSDPLELKSKAKGRKKKARMNVLVADLEINGNPLIGINEVITIGNVANVHEGNWYVTGVNHTIQSSAYTTVLRLKKDAFNGTKPTKTKNNTSTGADPSQVDTTEKIEYVVR